MGIIEEIPEISKNFSEQKKAQNEKFIYSASTAYMETYKLLKERDINLTGPEQYIICTLDPRTMLQALLLYEKMGFIEIIKKNPSLLRCKVVAIMRRMAQCDAANIPYRDEKTDECANFIFDGREFNQKIKPLVDQTIGVEAPEEIKDELEEEPVTDLVSEEKASEVVNNVVPISQTENVDSNKLNRLKEYATYLLPVFGYTSDENYMSMMQALDQADLTLSDSDVLFNAFVKTFNAPESTQDMLRTQIKTVIELNTPEDTINNDQEMKRVVGL